VVIAVAGAVLQFSGAGFKFTAMQQPIGCSRPSICIHNDQSTTFGYSDGQSQRCAKASGGKRGSVQQCRCLTTKQGDKADRQCSCHSCQLHNTGYVSTVLSSTDQLFSSLINLQTARFCDRSCLSGCVQDNGKNVCRFFWVDRLSEKNFNINFSLVICISLNQPL